MGSLVDPIVRIGMVGHIVVCMLIVNVAKEICDTPVAVIALIA